MAKTPTPKPLEIPFFGTGFYTYRSQLFAPFKSLGINVVSYHDSVLDGADMELTDLMEWQQRPGFTQFCTEALGEDEIINQFYSARALNGVLLTMFDSNKRLATFTDAAITTLYEKNTEAQGFVNQVGNTTYFYDGVDAVRYDQTYGLTPNGIAAPTQTLTLSATGGWLPKTFYKGASVLLDYNGNIEYAANVSSAGVSLLQDKSSSSHAVDGTWWENVSSVDQWRTTGHATSANYLTPLGGFVTTGFGFSVPDNAIVLGIQVFFGTIAQFSTSAYIQAVSLYHGGAPLGVEKNPATPFVTSYQNLTYGVSTDTWGATLTPAIVNDTSFGFAIAAQLFNQRVFLDAPYSMRVYYFIPSGTGGTAGVSGNTLPTWSALPGSYTSDGTLRWNNLGVVGQWEAVTAYTIPSVILDSNNNLQSVQVLTAVEQYDPSKTYNAGDVVNYAGQWWTAQQTITGKTPNVSVFSANTTGGTTTYVYNWIQTPDPQTSGGAVPVWNTVKGGTTDDGALVWTNIGPGNILVNSGYEYGVCYRTMDGHLSTMSQPTISTGPLLGGSPLQTSDISSFSISSNIITFYSNQTFSPGELVYVEGMIQAPYLNDQTYVVLTSTTAASFAITGVSVSGNVATFTANNTLTAGQQVTISGLAGDVALNGLTLTVSATGLSGTQFEANVTSPDYSFTPDNGTAIVVAFFTAALTHADVPSTPDVGTVSPVIAQLASSGIDDARLDYSTNITNVSLTGNMVTLTCDNIFFPGNTIFISGLQSAAFLNDFTLLISTATATQVTAYFAADDYGSAGDNGTATFCGIEVYRTADGGGIWYLDGAVVNPGSDGTWQFTDINGDSYLNEQLVAPIAHLNDPPPGQTGSIANPFVGGTLCAYWQGRQWLAQGQFLYFDAGSDCLNGDPHQSWPPGNRFEYPGTIIGIAALESGLVVLGADYFGLALGGPQTLTFYPIVVLKNFGITSPNCLYQDGQTLHVLTTQGQLYAITSGNKDSEGHYVANYIQDTFHPSNTYVTLHRNGLDSGLFLGDGESTLLRYGTNVGSWSVPYYPVGGVKAIGSIETSVGKYSLCAAPPTAGGHITARNLNAWADMGGNYTSAYSPNGVGITIGSITLSNPGEELAPVQHIVGYFDAVGLNGIIDQPVISILPNEINAATSVTGFITIPPDSVVPEPPPPTALVSTSLQQLRFPVNMWNSIASQFMHHLQIQIQFNNNNVPHTIKALAVKFDQQ